MKKVISYIVHLFIMPCSKATLMMEQKQQKEISLLRNLQLSLHLSVCKLCATYYKNLTILENLLRSQRKLEEKSNFQSGEIQDFKDRLKQKMEE